MGKGYIVVQLYSNNQGIPVTNAEISITKSEEGNIIFEEIVGVNESGKTPKIEVETPQQQLSLKPQSSEMPYGLYDVKINAQGYEEVIIKGVQVFDGITALQPVAMKELLRFRQEYRKNVMEITPHNLVRPTTYNTQMKFNSENTPSSTYTLGRVYIPEFIVVHLGAPDKYAENVTVRFTEYIKNVASSEIYPTWPENSLKANIFAQISFALNRIYTEWYRGRGYDFQITSSTAYDQYYVKGRNIFENINKIVDDIFNEYISTVGYKEPLFAQFCNGTTVQCKGLSQWGTVDLANKNYSTVGILKYYYGNDIELKRSTFIQGIPESYSGIHLRVGSRGEGVKTIQKQLSRVSKNYPAIPKLSPDGIFGKDTEKSVKEFQSIFNLTVDGIVGRATWYKISSIYVAVKRLAELDSEGEIEDDVKYPGYLIKEGMRGEEVEKVQYYLQSVSKFNSSVPNIKVDGIFGKQTKDAVIAFQKYYGLLADGIVGYNTWNKLYEVYSSLDSYREYEDAIYNYEYPGEEIKEGDKSAYVKILQNCINIIDHNKKSEEKLKVDGVFGEKTKISVKVLQKHWSIKNEGVVEKITWDNVMNDVKEMWSDKYKSKHKSKKNKKKK